MIATLTYVPLFVQGVLRGTPTEAGTRDHADGDRLADRERASPGGSSPRSASAR